MFYLEPAELAKQKDLATHGSNAAAKKVADHYGLAVLDSAQEYRWLTMAAERGDIGAMRSLAIHQSTERNGLKNCEEALRWLEKAKQIGSPEELKKHAIEDVLASLKSDGGACE
jgi:TPR repeat protein